MLDNDNAGEMATLNVGDELIKNNLEVKVVRLKGAKDPDEYIVKFGIEAFQDTIKHSIDFFDYKLLQLKENKNLNNTDELINYIKSVLKMLDNSDNLTKEITLKKLSKEYDIDYEILKQEINFDNKNKPLIIKKDITLSKKDKYTTCVNYLLYYLMSDKKYLKMFNSKLGYLKNPLERYLITEIEYYIKKYGKINLADFLSYAESDDKIREFVNNISGIVEIDELDDREFLDYLNATIKLLEQDDINKIKEKINNSIDINEQIENINKQIAIHKKMMDVKKEV